jgi:hypothetical protein
MTEIPETALDYLILSKEQLRLYRNSLTRATYIMTIRFSMKQSTKSMPLWTELLT